MINFNKKLILIYHALLAILPDSMAIKLMFFKNFGTLPNLKNPKTFNEKINWRKLYQHDPRFTLFSDKITAKTEIAKLIGEDYIIPTLWVGERPEDIPFEDLPCPYVIKFNNGYSDAFFIHTKNDINYLKIVKHFSQKKNGHYLLTREWGYLNIQKKIIVEKMLHVSSDITPNDYKFFVYDGRVHFIQMDVGRFMNHKTAFFDRRWNKLPFTKINPQIEGRVPKPTHYDLMVELAEKIGKQFDFVRIDFYDLPSGVFFGEVTFYPAGGFGPFHPGGWDIKMGDPWVIKQLHLREVNLDEVN